MARRVVARVGRAHGLKGEVTVEVRTDDPDLRFAVGASVFAEGDDRRYTVEHARWHNGVLLLTFEEVVDREGADDLRGTVLEADVAPDEEPDAYYADQLVGLKVYSPGGEVLGEVTALSPMAAQDLLTVRRPDGQERLVPFVSALVPEVDVAGGRIVVVDPGGLIGD